MNFASPTNNSNSAAASANLPKAKSPRTSWSGTKPRSFPPKSCPNSPKWVSSASFSPNNMAARAWATSNTPSPSKNFRAWTARSASSSPRTIRSARITSSNSEPKRKSRNTRAARAGQKARLPGRSPNPKLAPTPAARAPLRRRDGNNWLINGAKTFTTNGHYADICVAMAVTDKSKKLSRHQRLHRRKGHSRLSARQKGKQARAARQRHFRNDLRGLPRPAGKSPGRRRRRLHRQPQILDGGRISIAALALGMAQGALDAAIRYAKQRKQFGQPISEFQAIQFKLADMATRSRSCPPARLPGRLARRPGQRPASRANPAWPSCLPAKSRSVSPTSAVQIHGGYGFIKDYPAEKFYRDVKALHHRRRHQRNPDDWSSRASCSGKK